MKKKKPKNPIEMIQKELGSLWLIHVDVSQKLTQYCRTIIFQLKTNIFI